jgi:quinolinate synthase
VLAHPECPSETLALADSVESTEGILKFSKKSEKQEFIIATEPNMITRLKKEVPDKKFYPVEDCKFCKTMRLTELEDVYNALKYEQYEIELDKDIIEKSKHSLNQMLNYI